MKKLLLILFAACLASCSTYGPVVNFVDYSTYNEQGVFLTESNSVSFEYEPVGSVNVLLYSGYAKQDPAKQTSLKQQGVDPRAMVVGSPSVYRSATAQEALKIAVDQAQKNGANAIINLSYEFIPSGKNSPAGWFVSGMAVRK